jgi:hypothetical protein
VRRWRGSRRRCGCRRPSRASRSCRLSLGNGTPDVLSSVVAFAFGGGGAEGDARDVVLRSVLGGVLFLSTVVAGVVAIVAAACAAAVLRQKKWKNGNGIVGRREEEKKK